jgi:hypothetical protein
LRAELWIPGRLCGLNELMLDRSVRIRDKKKARLAIMALCFAARLPRFERAYIDFEWVEPNKRRDPDGFTSGGRKVILDALQHALVLPGDGWRHVLGFTDTWRCDPTAPGVLVVLRAPEVPSAP